MLYGFFLLLSILYNIRKFSKVRAEFFRSLIEATTYQHREMILGHHFHIFIFEAFFGFIISHLITEGAFAIGLLGLGFVYLMLLGLGLVLYQYFLRIVEKHTGLTLRASFNHHVIKEFRVSFALILLPIFMYSVLNWTFQDDDASILGILTNIIFVSVLTISCTVIIMLKLLPNREITEPEYLDVIKKRLEQINRPNIRVRWIETDIKNAFVVGIKLLRFSNQTMFIGRNLRKTLTIEEFDAVICHEAAHIANGHIQKRIIELFKNFVGAILGFAILFAGILLFFALYFGEDVELYKKQLALFCLLATVSWLVFNYSLFFDSIRSHEHEADAFAVMEMGASFEALKTALDKLSQADEMPEYLKGKTKAPKKKTWFSKIFSTHPEISERMNSVQFKMDHHLAFNHYISPVQKIRSTIGSALQWRVSLPLGIISAVCLTWAGFQIRQGEALMSFIQHHSPEEIVANESIAEQVNGKPLLVGKSLMYYIVRKQDKDLIDHYLNKGADPGRALIYLAETKNFPLFEGYFKAYGASISNDEYFLVLNKSAAMDFTEGYRYLVNSSKFESLSPDYKADLTNTYQALKQERKPASIKE